MAVNSADNNSAFKRQRTYSKIEIINFIEEFERRRK